jgi:hypothetical protein
MAHGLARCNNSPWQVRRGSVHSWLLSPWSLRSFPRGTSADHASRLATRHGRKSAPGPGAPTSGSGSGARTWVLHPFAPSRFCFTRPCLCGRASAVRWPPPWERQAPAWHGTLCRIGYLCPARWLGQPGCHAWRPAKGGGVRRGPAHLPRDQKENARAMAGGRKSGGERVFHSSTK